MKKIKNNLTSNNLYTRVTTTIIIFFIVFLGITIISYYLLPEGLLKEKNPLSNWEESNNLIILMSQIFFYNMLSVIAIIIGSLFGKKKSSEKNYFSVGYSAFFTFIVLNGIVLGTWSFSIESVAPSLIYRITRTFDFIHRAGLWEMMGQLLITCSLAHIGIILTNNKETKALKMKEIKLLLNERLFLIIGLILMLAGAFIESYAIINI